MKQALLLIVLVFAAIICKAQSFNHSPANFLESIDDCGSVYKKITVYPNPSNGIFNVALGSFKNEQITVMVLDANGRMVTYRRIEDCNERSTVNFDISKFGKGMYIIQVKSANALQSTKLSLT